MMGPDVVDPAALDALVEATGGDRAFLAEMIDVYVDDSAEQLAVMRQAIAEGNAEELRRAAHSLKANSASFGATTLAQLCQELEVRGKAAELNDASELLAKIEAEYEK